MDLGPFPVLKKVVIQFNRVASYFPEISTLAPLGGLLILYLFITVLQKLPLSHHEYYSILQRNRDLQASRIPQC